MVFWGFCCFGLVFCLFLPSVEFTIHLGRHNSLRRQLTHNSSGPGTGSLNTWVLAPSSATSQLCDLGKITSHSLGLSFLTGKMKKLCMSVETE